MSPSTSTVRYPASAKDMAKLADTKDLPSPGAGLETAREIGIVVEFRTCILSDRNASTKCASRDRLTP